MIMRLTDDNILPSLHSGITGHYMPDSVTVTGYALQVESRTYRGSWATIIIGGRESVYATLETARKRRSYLRQFDRRTWGESNIRNSRIVKITVSREVVK
jgi:hypothetical protein